MCRQGPRERFSLAVCAGPAQAGAMKTKDLTGQEVTLQSSQGPIRRIVVKDMGDVLLVCRREEYEHAKEQRRAPISIGFHRVALL